MNIEITIYIHRDVDANGDRIPGYTCISNRLIQDPNLKPEHVGIMNHLLRNQNDFNQNVKALAKKLGYSVKKLQVRLRHLESLGYIERRKTHDNNGNWSWGFYVYEIPRPPGDKPSDGEPQDGGTPPHSPSDAGNANKITTNTNKEKINKISLKKYKEDLDNKKELNNTIGLTNNLEYVDNHHRSEKESMGEPISNPTLDDGEVPKYIGDVFEKKNDDEDHRPF